MKAIVPLLKNEPHHRIIAVSASASLGLVGVCTTEKLLLISISPEMAVSIQDQFNFDHERSSLEVLAGTSQLHFEREFLFLTGLGPF